MKKTIETLNNLFPKNVTVKNIKETNDKNGYRIDISLYGEDLNLNFTLKNYLDKLWIPSLKIEQKLNLNLTSQPYSLSKKLSDFELYPKTILFDGNMNLLQAFKPSEKDSDIIRVAERYQRQNELIYVGKTTEEDSVQLLGINGVGFDGESYEYTMEETPYKVFLPNENKLVYLQNNNPPPKKPNIPTRVVTRFNFYGDSWNYAGQYGSIIYTLE